MPGTAAVGGPASTDETELVHRLLGTGRGRNEHASLRDKAARLERELIARLHDDRNDDGSGSPETRVRRLEERLEAHAAELAAARAEERKARREATAARADAESERVNAQALLSECTRLRVAHEQRLQLYRTRLAKYEIDHRHSAQPS